MYSKLFEAIGKNHDLNTYYLPCNAYLVLITGKPLNNTTREQRSQKGRVNNMT